MKWYLKGIRLFYDFKGRARRKEYWMFTLFDILIAFGVARSLDLVFGTKSLFLAWYTILVFAPKMAVSVRRLHDVVKSAWFILIPILCGVLSGYVISYRQWFSVFVAIALGAGCVWFFLLMIKDSQPGENQYGKNPKEEEFSG